MTDTTIELLKLYDWPQTPKEIAFVREFKKENDRWPTPEEVKALKLIEYTIQFDGIDYTKETKACDLTEPVTIYRLHKHLPPEE